MLYKWHPSNVPVGCRLVTSNTNPKPNGCSLRQASGLQQLPHVFACGNPHGCGLPSNADRVPRVSYIDLSFLFKGHMCGRRSGTNWFSAFAGLRHETPREKVRLNLSIRDMSKVCHSGNSHSKKARLLPNLAWRFCRLISAGRRYQLSYEAK
jgi:hypothetical protein